MASDRPTGRRWRVTQGQSRAVVVAPHHEAAKRRAAGWGFDRPDSVVLVDTAADGGLPPAPRPCWLCDKPAKGLRAHFGDYVPMCPDHIRLD